MIHATLDYLHWYRIISPAFGLAVDHILHADLHDLEPGRYEWAGTHVFALVNEYTTVAPQAAEPESHRHHADIQIMLKGSERFGYTPLSNHIPHRPFLPENDVAFYQIEPAQMNYIHLQPGEFVIFFPGDIHQPELQTGDPEQVRKLVVKVRL